MNKVITVTLHQTFKVNSEQTTYTCTYMFIWSEIIVDPSPTILFLIVRSSRKFLVCVECLLHSACVCTTRWGNILI